MKKLRHAYLKLFSDSSLGQKTKYLPYLTGEIAGF